MIQLRRSRERGHANHGWLDTYHSFSFDTYYDPRYMGFRTLRVINEDWVAPGSGFPTHPHRDMEIITYILEGALEHKDSMGTGSVIRPGEVQRMSAGTGVTHSEFNASKTDPVHLLQIWILPEAKGLKPSYEQREFPQEEMKNKLRLIGANDPADDAVKIHQDVKLFAAVLDEGTVRHELVSGRHAWIQVARGSVELNGQKLEAGDGAAVTGEPAVELRGTGEVLAFDVG
ncbi:MAG: pirin family protein [Acidobacteria bacterium]|nr:pirin family protein [Acidobacteriota bacterium]